MENFEHAQKESCIINIGILPIFNSFYLTIFDLSNHLFITYLSIYPLISEE